MMGVGMGMLGCGSRMFLEGLDDLTVIRYMYVCGGIFPAFLYKIEGSDMHKGDCTVCN